MKKTKQKEENSILELFEDAPITIEKRLDTCRVGDTIFLDSEATKAYEILDIGYPFVLILELSTGFCHLFKGDKVYTTK